MADNAVNAVLSSEWRSVVFNWHHLNPSWGTEKKLKTFVVSVFFISVSFCELFLSLLKYYLTDVTILLHKSTFDKKLAFYRVLNN